jgi:tRNA modification GTPase
LTLPVPIFGTGDPFRTELAGRGKKPNLWTWLAVLVALEPQMMGESFPKSRYHELLFNDDTIAAVATPPGKGAIGVVRLSGSRARAMLDRLFLPGGKPGPSPRPRRMTYGWLQEGEDVIDEAEVCYYPPPTTYTGEELVEFFVHGSRAVLRRLLEALLSCGARVAEPGEFTLRAFRNGRLELSRAEAVNDLVNAEIDVTRRLALRSLRGALGDTVAEIRQRLESILINLETELEFESDATEADAQQSLDAQLEPCLDALSRLAEAGRRQQMHPHGAVTVICGKPNVGKSSLLNHILKRERAIVSAIPGTTRDTLEEAVEVERIPLLLVDTAGVSLAAAGPDALGVERSLRAIEEADLVIFLVDLTGDLDDGDFEILRHVRAKAPQAGVVYVANKCDLVANAGLRERLRKLRTGLSERSLLPISAKVGTNVNRLLKTVTDNVSRLTLLSEASEVLVNQRQLIAVTNALSVLEQTRQECQSCATCDLVADGLRRALRLVSLIDGRSETVDILDAIFSRFCIGK